MTAIAVDCRFATDGAVRVRRIAVDGRWRAIEQGRQWQDANGRHVLVRSPGRPVEQLSLSAGSLLWSLAPLAGRAPDDDYI